MQRSKEAIFTHFSDSQLAKGTGTRAGVEAVMRTQEKILEEKGWNTRTIVGAGTPSEDTTIYPAIRSGYFNKGHTQDDVATVKEVLENFFDTQPVIAHNSTNAARHNPPFGEAVAAISEDRIDADAPPVILWYHDARGADPETLHRFFPHRREATVVCVSNAREKELSEMYDQIHAVDSTRQLPEDIRVVYNPINEAYLAEEFPLPGNLAALAPHFERFTRKYDLPQDERSVAAALFDDDTLKIIVPARIVEQKGITEAVDAADAYSALTGQKTALIVTGPPDIRKPENESYWKSTQHLVRNPESSNLAVVFLGGVEAKYMPWLLSTEGSDKTKKILMLPSTNEGFGMPPSEAACAGTPSVLTDIPAFQETTDGHALLLPQRLWKSPTLVARAMHSYITSPNAARDVTALTELVEQRYSMPIIGQQLEALLQR